MPRTVLFGVALVELTVRSSVGPEKRVVFVVRSGWVQGCYGGVLSIAWVYRRLAMRLGMEDLLRRYWCYSYMRSAPRSILVSTTYRVPFPSRSTRRGTSTSSFSRGVSGWCFARTSCSASCAYSIVLRYSAHRSFHCWNAIAGVCCRLLYPSTFVRYGANIVRWSIGDT